MSHNLPDFFAEFSESIEGDFFYDELTRRLYATDASAYRELPQAVAMPKSAEDIRRIIALAREIGSSVIPRTAGTSLAGQVVGNGIVVDVSKYLTRILEVNREERWVRLQPGVIRDELNMHLKPYDLLFGPETATANRAMVGGMVGNNSCGANSLVYGSTREHLLSVKMILADGVEVEFTGISESELAGRIRGENIRSALEQNIYRELFDILNNRENQEEIEKNYPRKSIRRRNTGYAIDLLLDTDPFRHNGIPFNVCKLIAGSEGTLGFITEIRLSLDPLPPPEKALICIHFDSLYQLLEANLVALKYDPQAVELIDHYILECTKQNIEQRKNRFFIQGDPKGILIIELAFDEKGKLEETVNRLIGEMKEKGYGYHYPVLYGADMARIWALRKAGLGLLSNIPGDAKPVPLIEDTAVDVNDLPAYIREMNELLETHGLYCVHYAHVGSGEIHIRPIIDLKTSAGQKLYRTVLQEVVGLVKKYNGSLSGEHGDGRLRGEFIPEILGRYNYRLLERVKKAFDPEYIFNPGKIVATPPMNTSLRYDADRKDPEIKTYLDFSGTLGILRAAEQCNGSGDCRKTHLSGGTMCPSYMATKNEKDTTRARANTLREFLTRSEKKNRFDHREILDVLDLCISCKGCKSECPSNVDVAKLKAEFLQQYHDAHGVPLRSWLFGNIDRINRLFSITPAIFNLVTQTTFIRKLSSGLLGLSDRRVLPGLHAYTLKSWYRRHYPAIRPGRPVKKVYLFCDEFTNYQDVKAGEAAVRLLAALGYDVVIPEHEQSGRALLSKGLLKKARSIAERNIGLLNGIVNPDSPLVGIEPSAILSFRDEYPDLVDSQMKTMAKNLAAHTFTFEEFISAESDAGRIKKESFTDRKQRIRLHVHCYQKTLSSVDFSRKALSVPRNFEVENIPSGCCGMAGSFGYEKEHYDVSMKIGELVLFPAIRSSDTGDIIAASGTSCRHQILHGTERSAVHPAEILWEALIKNNR
jgi:FAD/FMN-containing dehydrogenase/Fe-S oxidoreductase